MANWELSGCVQVRERLTGISVSNVRELAGVRVVISATTTGTVWNQWCDVRTGADGKFRCVVDKSDASRRFKIDVFLEDDLLRVMRPRFLRTGKEKGEAETAPIEAWKDESKRDNGRFGAITLDDASADNDDRNHARRAALWYVARHLQNKLAERNAWLGFNKQLTIVHPSMMNTISTGNRVHISADWRGPADNPSYNITDVVHEIMHIWNYQHNHGVGANWVCGIAGTHNRQEPRNIAFHEGFAQWASYALQRVLWARSTTQAPYHRSKIANDDGFRIADLKEFEKKDDCVTSALHLLVYPHAERLLFGTRTSPPSSTTGALAVEIVEIATDKISIAMTCPAGKLDLWDVLLAFRGGQHANWPTDWQVGNDSFGLLRFYDRVSDIFPDKFPQSAKDVYVGLLDPNGTDELRDHCTPVIRPIKPLR